VTTARIAALEPPFTSPVAEALERIMPTGVAPLALFRTLAVNERVFLRLMAGSLLDRGSISLRERELVIDRTCARCGSEYEWGVHIAFFAERVKLTPAEIAATRAADPETTPFAPRERLLLRLVDELHDTAQVSDGLWQALRAEFTEAQLVEQVALTGFYHLISFTTNAFHIPLETYAARFSRYTSGR
jgi:alkylhydroperoxidase family enzyme